MSDTELLHASHDEKSDIGATLPESVFEDLPALILDAAGGLNTEDARLLYAIAPAGKIVKVAVWVSYAEKGQFDGSRAKLGANYLRTGAIVYEAVLEIAPYVHLRFQTSGAGFEPDNGDTLRRPQPFPLETTARVDSRRLMC